MSRNNGLLQFQGNSSGGTSQLNLSGTGVADFSGSLGTGNNGVINIGSISGSSGSIYLGNSTLVLGNSGTFGFGGVISSAPSGALVLNNAGRKTLTLSGS